MTKNLELKENKDAWQDTLNKYGINVITQKNKVMNKIHPLLRYKRGGP